MKRERERRSRRDIERIRERRTNKERVEERGSQRELTFLFVHYTREREGEREQLSLRRSLSGEEDVQCH